MTHLDKGNFVLVFPQSLHDAVDAVAGQTEHDLNVPGNQSIDENFRCIWHDEAPLNAFRTGSAAVGSFKWQRVRTGEQSRLHQGWAEVEIGVESMEVSFCDTSLLRIAYLSGGPEDGPPVLFLGILV
ncbi:MULTISPECIES: hypothetical protein [unclassified Mesorhizobium]|uniref:hypothetical protein n=1 Tax=unclassified Mesorhizobium TaxID=325217 RepID=UPI001FEE6D87|nr:MULTISPECIES: hypothetical protein [unclassified Mesorhizobium]